MKITLIKPRMGIMRKGIYIDEARMEPLQLAVLAALTPQDVETVCYDDRFEEIPFEEHTDLVAITVETFTARRAYEIAEKYRTHNIPVIMGGVHPTLVPEETALYADVVCTGDAEAYWMELINDFRMGKLRKFYHGITSIPQMKTVPDRSIFAGKKYLPVTMMQFTRGCRCKCTFCATGAYFNKNHYVRPDDDIISEVKGKTQRLLFFVDDNFTSDKDAAKIFLRKMIPFKKKWITQLSIDTANDPELVRLLSKAGCLGFVVGFESIHKNNIESMNKSVNLEHFDRYATQIKRFQDEGIDLWATFTLGHDLDTIASIEDTIAWAMEQKFAFAAFNVLTPYPATNFYEQLKNEGRLLFDGQWWLHKEYRFNHAAFVPKNMTPDQLTEIGFKAKKMYNTSSMVIKRGFMPRNGMNTLYKLWFIIRYGFLFRKEVYKKQSLILGKEQVSV
jgi:radical SAM superfamily enzyme YgiQ (UPF0313 family)